MPTKNKTLSKRRASEQRDTLFTQTTDLIDFKFDAQVVPVFDDMVKRSVPGYQSMIDMIALIANLYGQADAHYYDLGASTGASALALGLNSLAANPHIIAVDNSPDMAAKCRENLHGQLPNFEVICADIEAVTISNAAIVVLNLTLQFIEPEHNPMTTSSKGWFLVSTVTLWYSLR